MYITSVEVLAAVERSLRPFWGVVCVCVWCVCVWCVCVVCVSVCVVCVCVVCVSVCGVCKQKFMGQILSSFTSYCYGTKWLFFKR